MYLVQCMIDSSIRLDHAHDYQELQQVPKVCAGLREELVKRKAKIEHPRKFESEYLLSMEDMR